jgi:predicted  nucleic acid-binding Zn-ribbon protein
VSRATQRAVAAAAQLPDVDTQVMALERERKELGAQVPALAEQLEAIGQQMKRAASVFDDEMVAELTRERLGLFRRSQSVRIQAEECRVKLCDLRAPGLEEASKQAREKHERLKVETEAARLAYWEVQIRWEATFTARASAQQAIAAIQREQLPELTPRES